MALFTASSLVAGVAGILFAARLGTVRGDLGNGFELEIITVVLLGGVSIFGGSGRMALDVVRRFPTPVRTLTDGQPAWDISTIMENVHEGLKEAVTRAEVASVAIDSWGVDYGFLDRTGTLLGPVHTYRSSRAKGELERVTAAVGRERIYAATGIQFLPFNTLYQLTAARESAEYRAASGFLMSGGIEKEP